LALKVPLPDPISIFVDNEISGIDFVSHTTPLLKIGGMLPDVIMPPNVTELKEILVAALVVTEIEQFLVVKDFSSEL